MQVLQVSITQAEIPVGSHTLENMGQFVSRCLCNQSVPSQSLSVALAHVLPLLLCQLKDLFCFEKKKTNIKVATSCENHKRQGISDELKKI